MESAGKRLEFSVPKHLDREGGPGGENLQTCVDSQTSPFLFASMCEDAYGKPCPILLCKTIFNFGIFDNSKQ